MTEDKFVKDILDKINHGVSRLFPIPRRLHFSLSFEFLSRGQENTIKTPLLSYARYLGIEDEKIEDISNKLKSAFDEIHTHTFVSPSFSL